MRHLNGGEGDPHAEAYQAYFMLADSSVHEPMSLHADHFSTNFGYGVTAYSKGELFLAQLRAVIGEHMLAAGMLDYFASCAFKHPDPVDFERVLEKRSGLELDWYFDEWINTTRTLDYAVDTLVDRGDSVEIRLTRKGGMIMPVDLEVTRTDGSKSLFNVPLSLMLGSKHQTSEQAPFTVLPPWQWTDPYYILTIPGRLRSIARVALDPLERTADRDRANNVRIR